MFKVITDRRDRASIQSNPAAADHLIAALAMDDRDRLVYIIARPIDEETAEPLLARNATSCEVNAWLEINRGKAH